MNLQNKTLKSFLYALIAAAALYAAGCVPQVIVKSPEAVTSNNIIPVSEEEYKYFTALIKEGKEAEDRARGVFWAGQYHQNKKENDRAVKYYEYNEKYYQNTVWGFLSVLRMTEMLTAAGKYTDAMIKIKILLENRHRYSAYNETILSRLKAVLSLMSDAEAEQVYKDKIHPLAEEYALYTVAMRAAAANDFDRFFAYAREFLMNFRDSVFTGEISSKFREYVKFKPVDSGKIGVMLPLSGKAVDIGRVMRNGIEMALAEDNAEREPDKRISLIYIDEESPKLEENLVKLIEEKNIIALIGPLYSKTVKRVMPIAESYSLAVFSPTAAQAEITGQSSYFFRNCGTARGQARAMADYVAKSTQYKKIATLFADNAFGKTMDGFFSERAAENGLEIARRAEYASNTSDFKDAIVALGGIDTVILKDRRSKESMGLNNAMEEAGKRIVKRILDYAMIYTTDEKEKALLPKMSIALIQLVPGGETTVKYQLDTEATKKLSYTMAKETVFDVKKQANVNSVLSAMGVSYEDTDRDIAISAALRLKADILVWGQIVEEADSGTNTSNFLPEPVVDKKGNTEIVYNFKDEDFRSFKFKIYVLSVADEQVLDEITIPYSKIKDPKINPLGIEAVYVAASDRKMVLIADQLKYYDMNVPVFATSSVSGSYILSFPDNLDGMIFPVEFHAGDDDPAVSEFVRKYREKYADQANEISANAYDLMKITSALINTGVDSRENFRKLLSGVRNFDGIAGEFSFNNEGDGVKQYYIIKLDKGSYSLQSRVKGD